MSGKAKKDKKVVDNLKRLGAKVIDDIESKFDVLVTDDKLIRNCKLLQAFTLGAKIVGIKWVEECIKKKAFVDIKPAHYIKDKEFDKTYKCNVAKLLEGERKDKLFENYSFYISPNL